MRVCMRTPVPLPLIVATRNAEPWNPPYAIAPAARILGNDERQRTMMPTSQTEKQHNEMH